MSVAGIAFVRAATAQPNSLRPSAPQPLYVEFSGPTECGPRQRLLELTRELLGPDADRANVAVNAHVLALGERRYRLSLELRGAISGERTLFGVNCDEALRAGAVVVALAINPHARVTPSEASSETPIPQPPIADAEQPASVEPAAPAAAPTAVDEPSVPKGRQIGDRPTDSDFNALLFGVAGRLAYGLTPVPRLGVKALVGVALYDVQVRAYGFFDPSTEHADTIAGTVRFTSLGGGVEACAKVWSWSRVDASLCAGWSITEVNASAPNVEDSTAQDALISAGVLGLGLGARLVEGVVLMAEAGYALPSSRPRFVVDVAGASRLPVHRVESGALAGLGLLFGL